MTGEAHFILEINRPLQRIFAVWFSILAGVFLAAALVLLFSLKAAYPDFYG